MLRYIVFDFDGTIVDNLHQVYSLVQDILAKKGKTLQDDLETLRQKGVRQMIFELNIPKFEWLMYYRSLKEQIKSSLETSHPEAGLPEVLAQLAKTHDLYVMSSNKRDNIEKFLRKHDLFKYFKGIYEDDSYFGKQHSLKKMIRDLHCQPSDVAYVGDEVRDIEASRKAGVTSIAVTWGYEGEAPLSSHNPDYLIATPPELLSIV